MRVFAQSFVSVVSVAFALTAVVHALSSAIAAGPSAVSPASTSSVARAASVGPRGQWPQLRGIARVLDGDTLEVGATRVRLEGIDAPEGAQTCNRRLVGTWACGTASTYALIGLVQNREVVCEDRGRDKYTRTLGICFVDGHDINGEMVRLGLAWAYTKYSTDYVSQEAEARAAKRGVWVSATMPPWDFRATQQQLKTATAQALVTQPSPRQEGCDIKGNVTRVGKIYHLPSSPWYGRIVMDEAQGRRWFCSEGEAIAAGWRPVFSLSGG